MPNERRTAMSKPWTVGKVRLFRPPDEILDVRRRDVETILEGNTEEPWQVFWSEKEWRNRPVFFTEDDLRFLQSINVIGGDHVDEPDGIVNLMRESELPPTRADYLHLAFAGAPPDEIDGEVEAELPPWLQRDSDDDFALPTDTRDSLEDDDV